MFVLFDVLDVAVAVAVDVATAFDCCCWFANFGGVSTICFLIVILFITREATTAVAQAVIATAAIFLRNGFCSNNDSSNNSSSQLV